MQMTKTATVQPWMKRKLLFTLFERTCLIFLVVGKHQKVQQTSKILKGQKLNIYLWKLTLCCIFTQNEDIISNLLTENFLVGFEVANKHVWTNHPLVIRALWNINFSCSRGQKCRDWIFTPECAKSLSRYFSHKESVSEIYWGYQNEENKISKHSRYK